MIIKEAIAYESSGVVDIKTQLPIRTTAKVRDKYRKLNPKEPARWYDMETGELVDGVRGSLPNYYVSQIIETEFSKSHNGVPEDGHFPLRDGSVGEIRFMVTASSSHYDIFISSIKESSVDIISFQRGYYKKGAGEKTSKEVSPAWYKRIFVPSWIK
tara:strand:- start:5700 stop:6170 length:471 start_codon:yes stop_codon:yes gene_type:complete